MFSLHSQYPILRFRRALLPAAALSLALVACDAGDALAPAEEPAAEPITASNEAVASADVLALTTAPRIAFASYRNGNNDIYLMDPQGYHVSRLTTIAAWDGSPAWSWDNKRIALVRPRKDAANVTHYDIYLINADGSGGHWARSVPSPYTLGDPSWSPDGSHLLVTISANGKWYPGWLNLASGTIGNFPDGFGLLEGKQPSYDPTGQRIVFVNTKSSSYSLDLMNANATGRVKLVVAPGPTIDGPAFSKDGKRIAFSNAASNGDQEIFVKSLVDGSVKRLSYSTGTDLWPNWSPDGSKIVFSSTRNGHLQIWSMSAAGGSATRLSHNSYDERSPAYSH